MVVFDLGWRDASRALAGVMLIGLLQTANADGPGGYGSPSDYGSSEPSPSPKATKEQQATETYRDGYRLIQHAEEFEAQGNGTGTDKAAKAAEKAYKAALKKFNEAVKLDPSMHEAYTYIGYANRKLGNYPDSLAAYEQALRINANDPQAIEYQGEAFLGLNRVDDAKTNYLRLYELDRPQAHKLLRAINKWTEANAAQPPPNVDVAALRAWATERENSHDPNEKMVW